MAQGTITSGYPNELTKVDKSTWADSSVEVNSRGYLKVQGRSVMEMWQKEYMAEFAKAVASKGGRILEVGFGMGLSASAIQKYPIDEHMIIEPNNTIFETLKLFAKKASNKVVGVHGMWQEVINDKELFHPNSFDGIFFDASPFDKKELHQRQFQFGKLAWNLLKKGGTYAYCNLCSIGYLKDKYNNWDNLFRKTQLPGLKQAGFKENDIMYKVIKVDSPQNHPKYQHNEALVITAIK
tara:strand:+ start:10038 stop:10751 length:714 start_codon:yes stop_codon:yes gene_type:complete